MFVESDQLSDEDIECAFIMLCRGVKFKDINELSQNQIIKSIQGFNTNNIMKILFGEITTAQIALPKTSFRNRSAQSDSHNTDS